MRANTQYAGTDGRTRSAASKRRPTRTASHQIGGADPPSLTITMIHLESRFSTPFQPHAAFWHGPTRPSLLDAIFWANKQTTQGPRGAAGDGDGDGDGEGEQSAKRQVARWGGGHGRCESEAASGTARSGQSALNPPCPPRFPGLNRVGHQTRQCQLANCSSRAPMSSAALLIGPAQPQMQSTCTCIWDGATHTHSPPFAPPTTEPRSTPGLTRTPRSYSTYG